MIGAFKDLLFRAARISGVTGVVGNSGWRAHRVLVLCYHGISIDDEHRWNPTLFISQQTFRRRMEILRDEGYNVLALDKAVQLQSSGELPPRSVVLTFDDGSATFSSRALPVLQELGFPATVYLTTYYCDRLVPVPALAASYLLWRARGQGEIPFDGLFGMEGVIPVASDDDRERVMVRIRSWLAGLSSEVKTHEIELFSQRLGYAAGAFVNSRLLQIMSGSEVRDLPHDLVQVELHTHRHRAPREPALFRKEIEQNANVITRLRGRAPSHFCYPSGIVRELMFPVLRELGIQSATTCRTGLFDASTDPLLVPRLTDSMSTSEETFRSWLSGVASILPRRH